MLTIKHISLSGREVHYLGHEVEFMPTQRNAETKTRSPIESAHSGGTVTVLRETRVPIALEGGTVFVMNDLGKTVSRYDLGASDIPINEGEFETAGAARRREPNTGGREVALNM